MFDLLGQPIDCLLGFAGGGEDGAFVVLEDLQPIRDVGGMIGARFAFQGSIRTKEMRFRVQRFILTVKENPTRNLNLFYATSGADRLPL